MSWEMEDRITEITRILNELEADGETVTTHDDYNVRGEKSMTVLTENFCIRWDQEKKRWFWTGVGRKILEK